MSERTETSSPSSVFSPAELEYLEGERRLGRLGTADASGRPHVTPVGLWSYNQHLGTIDVTGHSFAKTRKYRNVEANPQASLLVDDIASFDPFRPRAVIAEGPAEAIAAGEDGVEALIRITPEKVISWGLDSD